MTDLDVEVDAFLEHFGVKGMHWGVRNKSFVSVQKQRRLNKYGDKKSGKPLTKAQKTARRERIGERAKLISMTALIGGYIALNILAARGQTKVSDTRFKSAFDEETFRDSARNAWRARGGFDGGTGSTGRARAAASAARGERAVRDIINSERANQSASLLRMHQEGKMDAQQYKNFLKKLNIRYDRKLADLG